MWLVMLAVIVLIIIVFGRRRRKKRIEIQLYAISSSGLDRVEDLKRDVEVGLAVDFIKNGQKSTGWEFIVRDEKEIKQIVNFVSYYGESSLLYFDENWFDDFSMGDIADELNKISMRTVVLIECDLSKKCIILAEMMKDRNNLFWFVIDEKEGALMYR